ncbi:di-heme oxidoredictase family protein [Eleftheria terrae]|uniref:di-heme oxidoredictase family protein n=1 Tax=Eleftheria terrae TaxID=1597781 RepID=UPI00263AEB72|nr:di-heme oxidoredictase family protein [Eleftheria terrae]WKB55338.1 RICIN domain-containing protein [Eleftheria terrae]
MESWFGSRRAPVLAAQFGLCAVVLAGCGGGSDGPPSRGTASAQAAAPAVAAGRYSLRHAAMGQCLGVPPGSMSDGTKLRAAACSTDSGQRFDLSEVQAGVYKLLLASSSKALDVENASSSDGAPLQQWTDNGTNAQRFKLQALRDGVFALVNLGSGKCVEVAGTQVRQQPCSGSDAQQFQLWSADGGQAPAAGYVPLFPAGTEVIEQIQYTEPDGTLVTLMGARATERHARERGEPWDAPDAGPGRYLTFPAFYFQNRTFGLEIRDGVPAGRQRVEFRLRVNDGTFDGTTFSLFRNVLDPGVRDFGWSLNYGFNNPKEGNRPICHAGQASEDCMMVVDSNWRTDPHSSLKVGDKIELAPAPRLRYDAQGRAVIDGGGSRYYSSEPLYVVGVGLRPWYGVAPNLDSEPLPEAALLGGQTSVSYNYSDEPMRMFQQMANNIGIGNTKRFVEGRRLFHTSFADGRHSEHPDVNPVFSAHIGQLGPRFNQSSCIACHSGNGRTRAPALGTPLEATVLTGAAGADGERRPDPVYGFNIQQRAGSPGAPDHSVTVQRFETSVRTLPDGEKVELQKPVYAFKGPVPAQYSVRQAPQVIGMGLLEALSEDSIVALADPDDRNQDGVRGVPNFVLDPETGQTRLGRFGWKAAKASVRHQAAEALVNDMGVVSPVYPSRRCQQGAPDCRSRPEGSGVSESELQRLSQYLQLIGVPAQRSLRSGYPAGIRVSPEHDVNPQRIARGATAFAQARCTACHVAQLKTGNTHPFAELRNQVIRPYADLLLHDMGPGLADTLAEGRAQPSMWRTAPLWGLGLLPYVQGGGQQVRYLHDGRARSLMEAILWHAGEADASRRSFESLSKEDRDAVIAFLQSL